MSEKKRLLMDVDYNMKYWNSRCRFHQGEIRREMNKKK